MREHRAITASVLASVTLALASCSANDAPDPTDNESTSIASLQRQAEENGWANASALLKDGQVTKEDLRAAFDNMAACAKPSGATFTDPQVNPVDGWRLTFDLAGTPSAEAGEAALDCQAKEYDPISIGYEVTHDDAMDPALMKAVQACLAKRGITTTGQEMGVSDLVPAGAVDKARGDKVVACVTKEATSLFPNATIVTSC
jgi:hypothetical protein